MTAVMKRDQVKERHARAQALVKRMAQSNGEFMRETLDKIERSDDPVACATARMVSVLIQLRKAGDEGMGLLTPALVQAAIDGFMEGANVTVQPAAMGGENYIRKERT